MSSASTAKQQSKQERRDAAREQARKLREAQQRRNRRNRILIITGVVAFVAVVVIAVVSILTAANRSPLEGIDGEPAGATDNGGIVLGAEGVGSTNEGAPEVEVYLDYLCTHCWTFETTNAGVLDELATAGEATVTFHPVAFMSDASNFSQRGAQALAVVATAAPEQFSTFNEGLFSAQPEGGATVLSDEQIAGVATEVGVPQNVIDSFAEGEFSEWVSAATQQATKDGIGGTPTILIDGEEFTGWQTPGALAEAVRAAA
ncbi:DsbA family protein [Georgenia sunbinii]|uniref:DsbA family protein n=1 Tax=Georgenia sunbinii TaxID=3117728 RepID=UPI002F26AF0F